MKTEKEKWANDVMNSFDGIQSAEASPFLYNKILNKLNTNAKEYASAKLVWLAVASFALLILLNWQTVEKSKRNFRNEKNSVKELANQYQLLTNDFINYN